jgi:hypothetical protein
MRRWKRFCGGSSAGVLHHEAGCCLAATVGGGNRAMARWRGRNFWYLWAIARSSPEHPYAGGAACRPSRASWRWLLVTDASGRAAEVDASDKLSAAYATKIGSSQSSVAGTSPARWLLWRKSEEMAMIGDDQPAGEARKLLPGDETEPGAKQSAEGICPACAGTGRLGRQTCPDCGGTGTITVIVGDA